MKIYKGDLSLLLSVGFNLGEESVRVVRVIRV